MFSTIQQQCPYLSLTTLAALTHLTSAHYSQKHTHKRIHIYQQRRNPRSECADWTQTQKSRRIIFLWIYMLRPTEMVVGSCTLHLRSIVYLGKYTFKCKLTALEASVRIYLYAMQLLILCNFSRIVYGSRQAIAPSLLQPTSVSTPHLANEEFKTFFPGKCTNCQSI